MTLSLQAALATCHTRIGFTLRTRGESAEALGPYEQAREIQERLVRDGTARASPSGGPLLDALEHRCHRAGPRSTRERDASPRAGHRDPSRPGQPRSRATPGIAAIWPGAGAISAWRSSPPVTRPPPWSWPSGPRQSTKSSSRTNHEDVEFRWRLARCLDEVGRIRSRSGRPADAGEPLERSAEFYESVARDNPVPYRLDVARNQLNLAFQRAATGRLERRTGVDSSGRGLDESVQLGLAHAFLRPGLCL